MAKEVLLIDDSEFLTILVGGQVRDSRLLHEVFGITDGKQLSSVLQGSTAYAPLESENAALFTDFIEQRRYERADGPPMSVRVVSMEGKEYVDVHNDTWVEDS